MYSAAIAIEAFNTIGIIGFKTVPPAGGEGL
jgi:hypothetical protein